MCTLEMKKSLTECGKGGTIKMNKKQYNNVINHTLKYEQVTSEEDNLASARAIFKNLGVALPQGDMKTVCETIKTDNYMGWKLEALHNGRSTGGCG